MENNGKRARRIMSSAVMATIFLSSPVLAQKSLEAGAAIPADGAENAADNSSLGDIVVTARKRDERLLDIPASIAAVTSEAIENAAAHRLSDLANYVPNLAIDGSAIDATIRIRGVGATSRNIGFDSRVGVYVDGVYIGQSPGLDQELVDIERVEVLRGPQGALSGKNTVAGAINIISKKPSHELSGELRGKGGNYGSAQVVGRLNLPVNDDVALKVSLNRDRRDGWARNTFLNRDTGSRNATSYRAQLSVDPTENLSLLITVNGVKSSESSDSPNALSDTFGINAVNQPPRQVTRNVFGYGDRRIFGASFDATYTLPNDFAIRSLSSYQKIRAKSVGDIDYSELDFTSVDYRDSYAQETEELQILSPKGDKFDFVLGFYYYRQRGSTDRVATFGTDAPLIGLTQGSAAINNGSVLTRNIAIYGNLNYNVTDRLNISLGGRVSKETKAADWSIDTSTLPFGLATGQIRDSRVDHDLSPTVTIGYKVTANTLAYLRYAEGYKSGGFNLDYVSEDIFPGNLKFAKEKARNYEAGLKGRLLDNHLTFALAAFWTNYTNYQVNQFRDLGGGRTALVIGNAATVRTKGIEAELSFRPVSALTFSAGLGVLDAKFASFPGGGAGGEDLSGNRLPGASHVQASAAIDYNIALGDGDLALRAHVDYSYRGGYYSTVDNLRQHDLLGGGMVPWGYISSYGLVDGRVGVGPDDSRWEVALWARNLLNKTYLSDTGRDFFGTLYEHYAPPRTYGVEMVLKF